MPENKILGGGCGGKEAVCIHTKKVYDACRSQDCLEDVRVYLTCESQAILDHAINVKPKSANILWIYVDVEPVPFNDGFYTVDLKFFYRVTADAFCGIGKPAEIEGLATFDKRVILFGSEGKSRIFSSQMLCEASGDDKQLRPTTNLPLGVAEVVDPIVLAAKIVEPHDRFCGSDGGVGFTGEVPEPICGCFHSQISPGHDSRRLYVTLGQFSIVKLERDTQLLIPSFDYCIPEKECTGDDKDPCDVFAHFRFPVNEFFPPDEKPGDHIGCKK